MPRMGIAIRVCLDQGGCASMRPRLVPRMGPVSLCSILSSELCFNEAAVGTADGHLQCHVKVSSDGRLQ